MKNIIFDLGNVLILFDPSAYVNEFIPKEKQKEFLEVVFQTSEWKELDLGTLSYDDAKAVFKKKLKTCDKEIDALFQDNLYNMLKPIEMNVALLDKLKDKYNLYILSNFHKDAFEAVSSGHDFFNKFDGGIVSAYHNCIKPDEKIYNLLISKYNLKPDETLFIDDMEENILKAKELGINTMHLTDYTKLEEHLINMNII